MPLTDLSPTSTAESPFFGALYGDNQLANFVDLCAQYPHIRNVQRYSNLCPAYRLLLGYLPVILPLILLGNVLSIPPISGGYHGDSQ
jgi:hypothetical protein